MISSEGKRYDIETLTIDRVLTKEHFSWKVTHMWRRWGIPQNLFLEFIDELKKQTIKETVEVGQ